MTLYGSRTLLTPLPVSVDQVYRDCNVDHRQFLRHRIQGWLERTAPGHHLTLTCRVSALGYRHQFASLFFQPFLERMGYNLENRVGKYREFVRCMVREEKEGQ